MKLRIIALAATLGLSATMATAQECTSDVIQAKTAELTQAVEVMAAKDPVKTQELLGAFQVKVEAAQAAQDDAAACAAFDELLLALNE